MVGVFMESTRFSLNEKDYKKFSELVYRISGINLHEGKKELLQARIGKIIRKRGLPGFAAYFEMIVEDESGEELVKLLDAVSTNLTFFFREEKHFEYLTETWLPAWQSKRRQPLPKIRGWSAGCSTGEEPYSILMSLLEKLGTDGDVDIRILGSDISTRVLSIAAEGTYPEEKFRSVPAGLRLKYFHKVNTGQGLYFRAGDELVRRALFRRINLMEPFPLRNPLDFIFCRNVMIYFDRPTQQTLVNRFHQSLAPGGILFIGHSESLNGVNHPFRYVAPSIYRRE